ncbi:MAG: helicase-related protein, partial [Bdellovibrionota bacterium]
MARIALPIDRIVPEIVRSLENSRAAVVHASPGSGKTTRVPAALLHANFRHADQEILVLEPRRLAAKLSAARVAQELGTKLGALVGYQFRFENVSSRETRLRFLTEGMLMRRLLSDRHLKNVACVVLDEFHERHLHTDLALAFLKNLQATSRPDLRLLVMSATLEAKAISTFLGNAPVHELDAPVFPVETEFLPSAPAQHLEILVKKAVQSALEKKNHGDILVFLPGMREIRRAQSELEPLKARGVEILPLHGELTREEQDAAIQKSERTKVILATNVAETSLTIEGVATVIDSGLHRQASYSWWSGVPTLRTRPISRASAIQRAGRAGRTQAGRCLRLYTRGEYDSRPAFESPEIRRADLTQTCLELRALGVQSLRDFSWFEMPEVTSLAACDTLLHLLGAQTNGTLTEVGEKMAGFPAHPRLARFLLEAQARGVADDALTLSALISEGALENPDPLSALGRLTLDEGSRKVRSQLSSALGKAQVPAAKNPRRELRFSLLAGFPDRVVKKRTEQEVQLSSGGSAKISPELIAAHAFSDHELAVALEVQETKHQGQARAQAQIRSICAIEPEWLFDLSPTLLREVSEASWDSARSRVTASEKLVYGEITLSESPSTAMDEAQVARILSKVAFGFSLEDLALKPIPEILLALGKAFDPEVVEATVARVELLAKFFPESGLAPPSSAGLAEDLAALLSGKRSLEEVRGADFTEAFLAAL